MKLSTGARGDTFEYSHEPLSETDPRCPRSQIHGAAMRAAKQPKMSRTQTTQPEKCYDPQDATLTFVEEQDHLDFFCEGFASQRAQMSCGHAVTPASLTSWCQVLLFQGKSRFVCAQPGCDAVWPFEEVCKMALLTPKEKKQFKRSLAYNSYKENFGVQTCPGCMSSVQRKNKSNLRVRCKTCTAKRGRTFEFCWQCLREWKGPQRRSDRCDNDGCYNPALRTLAACPEMTFDHVSEVRGCPSVRACPTCGALLEHSRKHCKTIVCPRCTVKFCFVCLKLATKCDNLYNVCASGVAPRQTSIPVWKTKQRQTS
ncbi:probable E3 ubiquitin-protein ligase ARI8 [Parambassis ranga]|uniref:Probable E3 ubiquitin-protein ligase ARI8 n=1 Tax=Parambassis ranga TaxID=210632 RepID=A0A6P7KDY2_9TELE|nr:probable E3 ubiquitin-protein ligase ARI8 [Parambassis ranga]